MEYSTELKRGGGAILNVSSASALAHGRKHSKSPAYDVAKAGVLRLTTTLASVKERENIRVNCMVPDWVASDEVRSCWHSLTAQQHQEQGVPPVLISLDEIADTVVELITNDRLAGRVMVWWNGDVRRLIPLGDSGYRELE